MSERDDDVAWIETRERGEAAGDHPRAAAYARLGQAIGALPMFDGGVAWREQVLAQLTFEAASVAAATGPGAAAVEDDRLPRARRRRAIGAAMVSAVALAAVLIVILRPDPPAPAPIASRLDCEVTAGGQRRAQPDAAAPRVAAIGDTLAFTATIAGDAGLWIYGGDRLVLRCPGAAGCAEHAIAGGRRITASVRADAALTYTALLVAGGALAPLGSLGTDADRFQHQIAQTSAIDVR